MPKTYADHNISWVNERRTCIKRLAELTKKLQNKNYLSDFILAQAHKQDENLHEEDRQLADQIIFGGCL